MCCSQTRNEREKDLEKDRWRYILRKGITHRYNVLNLEARTELSLSTGQGRVALTQKVLEEYVSM